MGGMYTTLLAIYNFDQCIRGYHYTLSDYNHCSWVQLLHASVRLLAGGAIHRDLQLLHIIIIMSMCTTTESKAVPFEN